MPESTPIAVTDEQLSAVAFNVREAYYDCDGDTLLFAVEQEGRGACHTGEYSCFFRAFGPDAPTD